MKSRPSDSKSASERPPTQQPTFTTEQVIWLIAAVNRSWIDRVPSLQVRVPDPGDEITVEQANAVAGHVRATLQGTTGFKHGARKAALLEYLDDLRQQVLENRVPDGILEQRSDRPQQPPRHSANPI